MSNIAKEAYYRQIGKSDGTKLPVITEEEIDLFIKHRYNNQKNIRTLAKSRIREIKREFKIEYLDYIKLTQECAICGFSELINLHHIISISKGGTDTIDNYIGLCFNCHKLHHMKRWSLEKIKKWYEVRKEK